MTFIIKDANLYEKTANIIASDMIIVITIVIAVVSL